MTSSCSNDEPRRDYAGHPADVAQHVVGCHSCGTSLDTLKTQGDALKYLANRPEQGQVVVERVLSNTAQAGRTALADLLYELAKACLIADPQAELRTYRGVEPRPVEAVSQELKRVQSRLPTDGASEPLPSTTPPAPAALRASKACIDILENVEGATPRQRLITAQVLLMTGGYSDAERLCRALLSSNLSRSDRTYAAMNLVCALNRQDRFDDAVDVGERALQDSPETFLLAYNFAVSLARSGRLKRFKQVSEQISALFHKQPTGWQERMIRSDSQTLAECLECLPHEVVAFFGLPRN